MAKKTRKKKVSKKKKATKRRVPRKKKGSLKQRPKKTARKAAVPKPRKKGPELPAEPIGRVTHYFPRVKAAAVRIERDGIRVGDVLYFKGHTTRFKQRVDSLQINHQAVSEAPPGEEAGIRVNSRTRESDLVFKL